MKTKNALATKRAKRTPGAKSGKAGAHHVDIVWILLWVFLLVFLLITIGIFFATMQPAQTALH